MTFTFKMRGETFAASTLQELSAKYCAARDASGEGNSTFPKPTVRGPDGIIGSFSYNGRIWTGKPSGAWESRAIVYDNRSEA